MFDQKTKIRNQETGNRTRSYFITVFSFLFSVSFFLTGCSLKDDSRPASNRVQPSLGDPAAPVLVEEFADLQCPACGVISPQVVEVVKKNPLLARLHFYHFPLPQHENAFLAAEASECAGKQGKFWEYAELVFKNQKNLNKDFFYTLATDVSLDSTAFKTCLDDHEQKSSVLADLAEGRRKGVNSTPTLFVNDKEVRFTSMDSFERYLKSLAPSSN